MAQYIDNQKTIIVMNNKQVMLEALQAQLLVKQERGS